MDYFSDSMGRVHKLFSVAKCFAAKGVEKDDEPLWVAGTFAMLLDLIQEEIDKAKQVDRAEKSGTQIIDNRPPA